METDGQEGEADLHVECCRIICSTQGRSLLRYLPHQVAKIMSNRQQATEEGDDE